MMTFAAAANAAAAQNKKKTYRICKWSGDCDADDEYYWRGGGDDDDEDTGTHTADERRYYKWYLAQSRVQWRDDDVDDSRRPVASVAPAVAANKKTIVAHVPFMNLTAAERAKKSKQFKFGLCSDCDAGLCNESDFVSKSRPNGAAPLMTCNACSEYFRSLSYMRVEEQKERGGCN
jgi:hypothetical protein